MSEPYRVIYKLRGLLMAPPYLFLLAVFSWETESDVLVWPMGLALFGAGLALRIWAQMHLHYRLSVHKQLTVTGPYACVRNPIYMANALILLGVTVLSELMWFLPIMFCWCMTVYYFVVRREEAHLLEKYGQPYADYMTRVPRWIPRLNHVPGGLVSRWDFLRPSLKAELPCLLLLLPLIGKEFLSETLFHM